MIIYKITNLINNKVYIGLTTKSLTYRWSRHLTEGRNLKNQKPLYRAIRKYGKGNFQIEEIDSAPDIKTLGELERYYTNHTLLETFQRFGKTTLNSFREVVSRSYKNISIYHKLKKQWTLGKEIIDINNYKL